jgi:hypothetical protein
MCHQLLFNFPMNRRYPIVSPSSNRRLDSAPPVVAWLNISPPHHRLPNPIKRAPISAPPHHARRSPPFLTSEPRAPSHRGTLVATSVYHRPPSGPLRRLMPTGVEIPVPSSCFSRHHGEVPRKGTPVSRAPVSSDHYSCPWSTVDCEPMSGQWPTGPCARSIISLF